MKPFIVLCKSKEETTVAYYILLGMGFEFCHELDLSFQNVGQYGDISTPLRMSQWTDALTEDFEALTASDFQSYARKYYDWHATEFPKGTSEELKEYFFQIRSAMDHVDLYVSSSLEITDVSACAFFGVRFKAHNEYIPPLTLRHIFFVNGNDPEENLPLLEYAYNNGWTWNSSLKSWEIPSEASTSETNETIKPDLSSFTNEELIKELFLRNQSL